MAARLAAKAMKTGRPSIGPRPMTSTERARACRARQQARKLAERPELREAAAMTAITSRVIPPPPAIVAAVRAAEPAAAPPPPPPLPDDPAARAAAVAAEIELTLRAAALDPSTPAASRIAAARSLGELHGLLKTRAMPVDPAEVAARREMDPEWLAAEAEATRREIRSLRASLRHTDEERMPWD